MDGKKTVEDFVNDSKHSFSNISSESERSYTFPGGIVTIKNPLMLHVSENGHRIWDAQNKSHYIPMGWIHLEWCPLEGKPNFSI